MILITGATGNIGTELVTRLVSKRTPIRIITRDEKKIAHLGAEVGRVIGDRHEPSVVQ
ncbi:MAG: polysaccharide biosynthesis protein [Verrucomicrobia bacterium]|nr:polysaccharide biosynthesis protein [Verrucomicrobiota bacterium]